MPILVDTPWKTVTLAYFTTGFAIALVDCAFYSLLWTGLLFYILTFGLMVFRAFGRNFITVIMHMLTSTCVAVIILFDYQLGWEYNDDYYPPAINSSKAAKIIENVSFFRKDLTQREKYKHYWLFFPLVVVLLSGYSGICCLINLSLNLRKFLLGLHASLGMTVVMIYLFVGVFYSHYFKDYNISVAIKMFYYFIFLIVMFTPSLVSPSQVISKEYTYDEDFFGNEEEEEGDEEQEVEENTRRRSRSFFGRRLSYPGRGQHRRSDYSERDEGRSYGDRDADSRNLERREGSQPYYSERDERPRFRYPKRNEKGHSGYPERDERRDDFPERDERGHSGYRKRDERRRDDHSQRDDYPERDERRRDDYPERDERGHSGYPKRDERRRDDHPQRDERRRDDYPERDARRRDDYPERDDRRRSAFPTYHERRRSERYERARSERDEKARPAYPSSSERDERRRSGYPSERYERQRRWSSLDNRDIRRPDYPDREVRPKRGRSADPDRDDRRRSYYRDR